MTIDLCLLTLRKSLASLRKVQQRNGGALPWKSSFLDVQDNAAQDTANPCGRITNIFTVRRELLVKSVHHLMVVLTQSTLPKWLKYLLHSRIMMPMHEEGFKSAAVVQAAS